MAKGANRRAEPIPNGWHMRAIRGKRHGDAGRRDGQKAGAHQGARQQRQPHHGHKAATDGQDGRQRATGVHSTNGTADGRRREANQKAKAGSRSEHMHTEEANAIES